MALRNVGLSLRSYTTAQLATLITRFGPAGTQEINGIAPGTLVYNSTTGGMMVFNGTTFVAS